MILSWSQVWIACHPSQVDARSDIDSKPWRSLEFVEAMPHGKDLAAACDNLPKSNTISWTPWSRDWLSDTLMFALI
jgi:hypothetical protein